MSAKIKLLIIDPQNDFCDGPSNGKLPVQGAWDDMTRLAGLIDVIGDQLDDVIVTLDSHHVIDIAHPGWWVDGRGNNPAPFTLISVADVERGVWTPKNPAYRKRSLDYVRQLEKSGRYVLIIWPEHCLIGSEGHAVQPTLFTSLCRWEKEQLGIVNYVTKGSNPFTEHYSAVQAEVPDPEDPNTSLNTSLIDSLNDADMILIAGQALSHCVKSTVTDIADNIGEQHISKFVFLSDCSSPVAAAPGTPDFPAIGKEFVRTMQARGMQVSTSIDFPQLIASKGLRV